MTAPVARPVAALVRASRVRSRLAVVAATVVALVVLALPGRAAAENPIVASLEWITADSTLVVRGRAVTVTTHAGDGDAVWYDVTVRVAATLKGKAGRRVVVAVRAGPGESAADWRGGDRLWFLVDSARRAADDPGFQRAPWALRDDRGTLRLDGTAKAYTAGFAVLSKRAALLAAVRVAARSRATRPRLIEAPRGSPAYRAWYDGSAVRLIVPAEPGDESPPP